MCEVFKSICRGCFAVTLTTLLAVRCVLQIFIVSKSNSRVLLIAVLSDELLFGCGRH